VSFAVGHSRSNVACTRAMSACDGSWSAMFFHHGEPILRTGQARRAVTTTRRALCALGLKLATQVLSAGRDLGRARPRNDQRKNSIQNDHAKCPASGCLHKRGPLAECPLVGRSPKWTGKQNRLPRSKMTQLRHELDRNPAAHHSSAVPRCYPFCRKQGRHGQ
jgi:hypothetical protein